MACPAGRSGVASRRGFAVFTGELLRLYRQTEDELRRVVSEEERLRARLESYRAQGMRVRTLEIRRADVNIAPFTYTALADEERYEERWTSRNRPYLELE